MAYDILIKSGTVIDGIGVAPVAADVAISEEQISAIGDLKNSEAKIIINALGKYITPGFIDITNHSDTHLTVFKYPGLESMVMQGVTTIVGGNCGASLAPLGNPGAIQAIRKWANPEEISINLATMEEYLSNIQNLKPETNYGTFVGYGTLRRGVIGDEIRLLSLAEREQVKFLFRKAMDDGAFGLSLGLAYGHERISTTEEIIDIAKILEITGGVLKIHLRSEGFEILSSINEAIRIAREVQVPVQVSHIKAIGRKAWKSFHKGLELIANAKASGIKIDFDVSPYRTTGSPLYLLLPGWARGGGFSALFKKIGDPTERKKIIEALGAQTLHYNKFLITSAKTKGIVGRTLAEVAEEGGLSPEEAFLQTLVANEGRVSIIGQTLTMKNTRLAMQDKNSFIASDGFGSSQDAGRSGDLIHPRSFGAFPRFLAKFASELGLSISDAIKKISSGPAEKLGIKNRGVLKKGNYADLVIFDPKLIKDRATYKSPYRYPSGMEWVFVNGHVAVEQGRYIGARAGKVLERT